jgi:beta-xylosidase
MKRIILLASIFLFFAFGQTQAKPHPKTIYKHTGITGGKFGEPNQIGAGLNIHFVTGHTDELDKIAAAGFKYIRTDFTWGSMERTRGVYNFATYDELVNNLNKRGMGAIGILCYSNSLYEKDSLSIHPLTHKQQRDVSSPQHPESVAAFAKWAAAMVKHFKGRNVIWEIWNEPNISFWKPKPNVDQYITLALATSKAIRAVEPDATIIGPCTSRVPLPFIEPFMASGILQYIDAVSVHPYREYSKSPETAIEDFNNLHRLIEKYAPADKKNMPIISSEWGYSTSTKGISEELQSQYIVRMQLANTLYGIPISIWYDWKNDGVDPAEHEENFGTVTADLKPKPAYNTVQNMNKQLNGFVFVQRVKVDSDNDYILLFKNGKGQYKLAAWTTDAAVHPIALANKITKVKSTTAIDGNGSPLKLNTDNNKLTIAIGALPQYISLKGIALN